MAPQVYALTGTDQFARLTRVLDATFVERDLQPGGFQVTLPADDHHYLVNQLLGTLDPGIEVWDPETDWRFGGFIIAATWQRESDGSEVYTLRGFDFQGDLQRWLEWPNPTQVDDWYRQVYAGTAPLTTDAHTAVEANMGASALTARRYPGLVFATDPGAGAPKPRRVRGLPLLEVLRGLFTGEDYTARLRLVRTGFQSVGQVEFSTPARPTANVVIDGTDGRFAGVEVTRLADSATFVVGMGAEYDDVSGARYVATSETAWTDWRSRRTEQFIARSGTDDLTQLQGDVDLHASEQRRRLHVSVSDALVEGFGRDIDIGWYAPVTVGVGAQAVRDLVPVTASTLTYGRDDGWARTVDIGDDFYDRPQDVVRDALTKLGRRARQIESEL